MSWASRFSKLKVDIKEPQPPDELDPVYISGSKFINDSILLKLSEQYPWADISNISFSSLRIKYADDFKKIINYLIDSRVYSKIYKHCEVDLLLIKTVHRYLSTTNQITTDVLENVYNECSDLLSNIDVEVKKTLFILDFTSQYFQSHLEIIDELLLYSSAALALINKHRRFHHIEFVVFSECSYKSEKKIGYSQNICHHTLIEHIQSKLRELKHGIKVEQTANVDKIIKLIINMHISKDSLDLDLF